MLGSIYYSIYFYIEVVKELIHCTLFEIFVDMYGMFFCLLHELLTYCISYGAKPSVCFKIPYIVVLNFMSH
jgi:hypothetical protein